jgi:predicted nucleic acid-binding protein
MRSDCFLDTNILIYAAAGKEDEPEKFRIAYDLVLGRNFGVSGQVLAEFYDNILRKPIVPPSLAEVDSWIDRLVAHPFVPIDIALVRAGIFLSQRFKIRYWDAALIAAAERVGAETLYTEDLNHGQRYGSVRVINPFFDEPRLNPAQKRKP